MNQIVYRNTTLQKIRTKYIESYTVYEIKRFLPEVDARGVVPFEAYCNNVIKQFSTFYQLVLHELSFTILFFSL